MEGFLLGEGNIKGGKGKGPLGTGAAEEREWGNHRQSDLQRQRKREEG